MYYYKNGDKYEGEYNNDSIVKGKRDLISGLFVNLKLKKIIF